MFSDNPADRVLKRSDFHLPKDLKSDEMESQELYIEVVLECIEKMASKCYDYFVEKCVFPLSIFCAERIFLIYHIILR